MNRFRRRLSWVLGLFPLASLLSSFIVPPPPLTIASHVWPGYELMSMARERGWFSAEQVTLKETKSATESMQALADGKVDGAALTLDEMLRFRAKGVDLVVVLVFDISNGADMVLARSPIRSLDELVGKRLGVEDSAVGALMLAEIFKISGLERQSVQVVPLTYDAHWKAWQQGEIDALITFEPVAGQVLRTGANNLFDSRKIPDTIFDVLAVKRTVAEAKADAIRSLVAGHFRAVEHLRRNPVDAGYRLAARLGGSGEKALNSFRGLKLPDVFANRRLLGSTEVSVEAAAMRLLPIMIEQGVLPQGLTASGLVRDDFLPEEN
ncbi:MAG: ABC transporter substrate-binding protein [Magnetococcales bacterium]|nr:ABC transporter substrate-binding protein [Magnetococcales bacterium]